MSDACRKSIEFASALADQYQLPGWRQREYLKNQHRKHYHKARNLKHSGASCELKKRLRQHDIEMAHIEYIKYSTSVLYRAEVTLSLLVKKHPDEPRLENLKYHIAHGKHQIALIYRRVIEHEQIPHSEKIFSIFEPHTEWISKGNRYASRTGATSVRATGSIWFYPASSGHAKANRRPGYCAYGRRC